MGKLPLENESRAMSGATILISGGGGGVGLAGVVLSPLLLVPILAIMLFNLWKAVAFVVPALVIISLLIVADLESQGSMMINPFRLKICSNT